MDKIMTSNPIVTTIEKNTPTQPSAIAAGPTCPLTVPYDRLRIILAAAEVAMCCHNNDTNANSEAKVIIPNASCDTGRDGKGLTSRELPSATSSCQSGKVARRSIVMNTRGTAVNLG